MGQHEVSSQLTKALAAGSLPPDLTLITAAETAGMIHMKDSTLDWNRCRDPRFGPLRPGEIVDGYRLPFVKQGNRPLYILAHVISFIKNLSGVAPVPTPRPDKVAKAEAEARTGNARPRLRTRRSPKKAPGRRRLRSS